jgi:hypothetical protein
MIENKFTTRIYLTVDDLLGTNRDDFIDYLTTDEEVKEVLSIDCVGSKNNLVTIEVTYKMPNHLYQDFLADNYDLEYNEYGQLIITEDK